jgi:hypothetical protein
MQQSLGANKSTVCCAQKLAGKDKRSQRAGRAKAPSPLALPAQSKTRTEFLAASELRGASWTAAGSKAPRRFRAPKGAQKLAARMCVRTAWNVYYAKNSEPLSRHGTVHRERFTAFGFTETRIPIYDPAVVELNLGRYASLISDFNSDNVERLRIPDARLGETDSVGDSKSDGEEL